MNSKRLLLICMLLPAFRMAGQIAPSKAQLQWHDQEFCLFMHFGPNTFTDKEWGSGDEPAAVFNPSQLDCRQWARIAKQAGAKGIIITAKHHDGFCLWPSRYSAHTVRESKWKNGKGDVLKELSAACKEYGLKFGVYISPWDRNHPDYGTPAYNNVFINMMKELFSGYGPIWELWWDGANGEGPNGKRQVYDWKQFEKTVRDISPRTVIFSDIGPDIRWIGNEKGIAGETNWNYLDTAGFARGIGAPPADTLNQGNVNGKNWLPGECDVSIRPGWFYHVNENDKVKTPSELFELYLKSVGRGANLLLNVPPDMKGLISREDSVALIGFKKLRDIAFENDITSRAKKVWGVDTTRSAGDATDYMPIRATADVKIQKNIFRFPEPHKINCIVVKEDIRKGQTIENFCIELSKEDKSVTILSSTIGHKRIITFPETEVDEVMITFVSNKKTISRVTVEIYSIDPTIVENKSWDQLMKRQDISCP